MPALPFCRSAASDVKISVAARALRDELLGYTVGPPP
jgi:hypothetical protein